ncbi:alpha/beta fold hydrolase [Aureimonas leprariae]|uniref:alpha/beta fold hydrolase n=1 Tax=Plantimonas leprariae TaxID=2615207 RepID=UPI0013872C07|nr:alpha/beta hydrolase [Aureimonas leprariae]
MAEANLFHGEYYVALDDVELSYTVSGSGPPLFAVSAGWGPGSSYLTRGLAPLTLDFTLVSIATRGSGKSSRPRDETAMGSADMARDVEGLRQHLGLPFIDLLGHSNGGAIAISFAEQFPKSCRRLVLVDSQLLGFDGSDATHAILAKRHDDPRYSEAVSNFRSATTAFDDVSFTNWLISFFPLYFYDPEANAQKMADTLDLPIRAWCAEKQWAIDRRPSAAQVDQLSLITAKTLIVVGEDDFITPVPVSERIRDCIRNSRLKVLSACGHVPWIEQPTLFFKEVSSFLKVPLEDEKDR